MATVKWLGGNGNWSTASDWSNGTGPGPHDEAVLAGSTPYAVALISSIGIASLYISDTRATLAITNPGGTEAISGSVVNRGTITLDRSGPGGTTLSVGGDLTNDGVMDIGNNGISLATVVAMRELDNNALLEVTGSGGSAASLYVSRKVYNQGTISLSGDVSVTFAGPISQDGTIIVNGNSGQASLNFGIDVEGSGTVVIDGAGATVAFAGADQGYGSVRFVGAGGNLVLDQPGEFKIDIAGMSVGASATIPTDIIDLAAITNASIFGATLDTANDQLLIATSDDGLITLQLSGKFATGTEVDHIADAGGNGTDIFLSAPGTGNTTQWIGGYGFWDDAADWSQGVPTSSEDALTAATSTISAVVTVRSPASVGSLTIEATGNGEAEVSVTSSLVVTGSVDVTNQTTAIANLNVATGGTLQVDGNFYGGLVVLGGGAADIAGTLVGGANVGGDASQTGVLLVGALAGSAAVGGATGNAVMIVESPAPTALNGRLAVYGYGILEFASGAIGTIGVAGGINISSPTGRIAIAGTLGSNSALALTQNNGVITVDSGGTLSVPGNLANSGILDLAFYQRGLPPGAVAVYIAGALNNTGSVMDTQSFLQVGGFSNTGLVDVVEGDISVLGGLSNTGLVDLSFGGFLNVLGAAPIVLTGTLDVNGTVEFGSGEIGTIASGAALYISNAASRVADAGNLSSNSALAGLSKNYGELQLTSMVTLTTSGNLTNYSTLVLDRLQHQYGDSALSVAGTLVNLGQLYNSGVSTLGAAGLINAGSLEWGGGQIAVGTNVYNTGTLRFFDTAMSSGGTLSNSASVYIGVGSTMSATGVVNFGRVTIGDHGVVSVSGNASNAGMVTIDAGALFNNGDGVFDQAAGSTFVAGTLEAGTVEVTGGRFEIGIGATVDGALSFASVPDGALQVDGTTMPTDTIYSITPGDTIDLTNVFSSSAGTIMREPGNTLQISENGGTYNLQLDPNQNFAGDFFHITSNGLIGTLITETSGTPAAQDFAGNGISDILWRNTSGDVAIWQMNGTSVTANGVVGSADSTWNIAAIGDFDGNGTADILWRNANGLVDIWTMQGGTVASVDQIGSADNTIQVAGAGDFDGNGTDDILWRNSDGAVDIWTMQNGRVTSTSQIGVADNTWSIAGTGDFGGNGTDDILWHNSDGAVDIWTMQNGQVASTAVIGNADNTWSIAGTGDFYGNGTDDILWHNSDGAVDIWTVQNGLINSTSEIGFADSTWQIAGTGDYFGNGTDDILWRNANGAVDVWALQNGQVASAAVIGSADNTWQIEPQTIGERTASAASLLPLAQPPPS